MADTFVPGSEYMPTYAVEEFLSLNFTIWDLEISRRRFTRYFLQNAYIIAYKNDVCMPDPSRCTYAIVT